MLPPSTSVEEDAFVAGLLTADAERLADAVREAVEARRLGLAARLVGLLDAELDDDPVIARARRAAALVVHGQLAPEDVSWSALDEALRDAHRHRVDRAQERQRRAARGDERRVGRVRTPRRR